MILTLAVDAPAGQAIGVKEAITYDLEEKYGDVRVLAVEEKWPKQQSFFGGGRSGEQKVY